MIFNKGSAKIIGNDRAGQFVPAVPLALSSIVAEIRSAGTTNPDCVCFLSQQKPCDSHALRHRGIQPLSLQVKLIIYKGVWRNTKGQSNQYVSNTKPKVLLVQSKAPENYKCYSSGLFLWVFNPLPPARKRNLLGKSDFDNGNEYFNNGNDQTQFFDGILMEA